LFFVFSLLPVLGLLQTGVQAMADRFMYLPSLGPFLLIGLGVAHIWSKADDLKGYRRLIQATVVVLVIASAISLSFLTNRQIGVWKNAIVMWSFLIDKDSGRDPALYIYRATGLEKSGQRERALDDYARALTIDPKSDRAYFNRGTNYLQQGKYDLAIEDYTTVLKLVPQEADAYNNRGNAYLRKGDVEQAIKDISVAIEKKPSFYPSYVNRSNAFAHKGELDKAIQDVSKAISLNPELLDMYVVRGNLNMKTGNFEQGMQDYKTACEKGVQEGCRKAIFPF
jgi:tetratricopeptide (TPR) repeat protein